MTAQNDDGRVARVLEGAFGAISDWLELVRGHENDRREREAAVERARREQATVLVMAVLSGIAIAALFIFGV